MITKMLRLHLLSHKDEVKSLLNSLQDLGLVHLDARELHEEDLKGEEHNQLRTMLQKVNQEKAQLKSAQSFLGFFAKTIVTESKSYSGTIAELLEEFSVLLTKKQELKTALDKLKKEEQKLLPWGDFEPKIVQKIRNAGLNIRLFICTLKQKEELVAHSIPHQVISTQGKTCFVATLGDWQAEFTPGEEFSLPLLSLDNVQEERDNKEKDLLALNQKIDLFAQYSNWVKAQMLKEQEKLELAQAETYLHETQTIMSISAWLPLRQKDVVEDHLKKQAGIAFYIEDGIGEANSLDVPVQLKNNIFSKLFEPITGLFSLPAYHEFDLTPFFAPFFAMFFGLCLGDAGYGLIFLSILTFAFFKFKKARAPIVLGMILNLCVIFWGIITGTTFGMNLFEIKIPILSDMALLKSDHVFYLALLIGLFQIFFGMIIQVIGKMVRGGVMAGLSTVGWIILIFFLTVMYLAGQNPTGDFTMGIAVIDFCKSVPTMMNQIGSIIGVALILFFNDLKVNIFLRIGKGLWELYGITGVVGDLLSYIRLFALGVSSAILGTVINSIAMKMLDIPVPVLAQIIFVLFLVVGHIGNMLLAALGSFVHPLRLTFVEFYKNAGFEGGGKPFKPLQKYSKT